jgi:hypothetical protein
MAFVSHWRNSISLALAAGVLSAAACATGSTAKMENTAPPTPDPRVGLKSGLMNAQEAAWNVKVVSKTPPSEKFLGSTNSDLAFISHYAIQGSYNGYQIWDITDPAKPVLTTAYYCPASQSDVSVYKNLLFVSGEGTSARLDCGAQGVKDTVSSERLRGIRIFDITDIKAPKNVGNVQTCRGSHTHSLYVDPKDAENVYVYISGSAGVRSPNEMAGCSKVDPSADPNSALFRIEVIKVPLAHPEQAAIVSSPRIFNDLLAPARHGDTPEDIAANKKAVAEGRAKGLYIVDIFGSERVLPATFTAPMLDSIMKSRGGTGVPSAADSAALRAGIQQMVEKRFGITPNGPGPKPGPTQCHDITLYPAIGRGGGACEGYGLLLNITNPVQPTRMAAVADSNFSYWHSATFNNAGTKILFSDEWGGGGQPKCRATDPKNWGADALFTIENGQLVFQSYYKMPAVQTAQENCVAHNGSLIPIPGRDVMVQAWYQGGISVFDWTDIKHPKEIAFFDRGPVDSARMAMGGSWSVYWYNGVMVSSEIARGLDIFALTPSGLISQNEIDAAKTVHLDYLNTQGQPQFVWPASAALAGAYLDQLEREGGMPAGAIKSARDALAKAMKATGANQKAELDKLAALLDNDAKVATDPAKVKMASDVAKEMAAAVK